MSWAQNRTSVLNKKIYPAYNMLGIDPAHNMLKIDPAYNMLKIDPTYNTGTRWLTTPCLWGLMRPFGLPRSQQRFLYFIFFSYIFYAKDSFYYHKILHHASEGNFTAVWLFFFLYNLKLFEVAYHWSSESELLIIKKVTKIIEN